MDPIIGQLFLLPYNRKISGLLPCDGKIYPIAQYRALFSLVGKNFGGDGNSTFGVPDLRGRVPVCVKPGSTEYASPGKMGGTEAVELTPNNLPPHNHAMYVGTSAATGNNSTNTYYTQSEPGRNLYAATAQSNQMVSIDPQSVMPAGGGKAHTNMQPFLVLSYFIAAEGIYPQRD